MLKIGLCEDNEIQHNQILSFLETISLPKHAINSFYKGNDLCNSIQEAMKNKEPYDIVIMDIDLPDGNGIKFSKQINVFSPHTIIIYMTSYEDYVFEGYKVNAFRYLKKPMEQEKLWEALLSAVSKLEKEYEIELWDEEGLHIVRPKDIIYVETSGRNVIVRTVEKDYCVKMGITQFAENLNGTDFISPHQSYYVNMRYIKEFNKQEAILTNGEKVKISCKKYAQFRDIYCEYRRNRRNH